MRDFLRVKSEMTPFPYSIDADQTLGAARQLMQEHQIRHLPVKSGENLLGILSDRELQLMIERFRGEIVVPEPRVRDVIRSEIYIVDLSTPVSIVAAEMAEKKIGSALVTKGGRLAGVFTVTDACRCLARMLRDKEGPPDDSGPEGREVA